MERACVAQRDKNTSRLCIYSFFEKGCRKKVHATSPKGIVGAFRFNIFKKNLKEWHERPWSIVLSAKGKQEK